MKLRSRKGNTDPLDVFPYETWLECVRLAITNSAAGPLPFLTISPRWTEAIIDSPALWTTIVIENGEDEFARVHTFLHLSATHLLDLHLDVLFDELAHGNLMASIFQHKYRLRSIVDNTQYSGSADLMAFLEAAGPFPEIQILDHYWRDGSQLHKLLQLCPNLRYGSIPLRINAESSLSRKAESLSFNHVHPQETLGLLQRENLKSLMLEYLLPPDHETLNFKGHMKWWNGHFESFSASFGSRMKSLDLKFSLNALSLFCRHLGSFSLLESLGLTLKFGAILPEPATLIDIYPLHGTNLRQLRLVLRCRPSVACGENIIHHQMDNTLFILTKAGLLQPLHSLELYIPRGQMSQRQFVRLLQAIPLVQTLYFFGSVVEEQDLPIDSITADSVILPELHAITVDAPFLLTLIQAPRLLNLDISFVHSKQLILPPPLRKTISRLTIPCTIFSYLNETQSLETTNTWPQLRHISFRFGQLPISTTQLSSIQVIEFLNVNRSVFAMFLYNIARDSGTCPHLHTIVLRFSPLWEPLFQALRLRNTFAVARITTMELPVIPVWTLLSKLVKLLQGQMKVFTSKDVDAIIAQRAADKTFKTCSQCLTAGYIQCYETEAHPEEDSSPREDSIDAGLFSFESSPSASYFTTYSNLMTTETDVEDKFEAILSKIPDDEQLDPCRRHINGSVVITPYTLNDVELPWLGLKHLAS